MSTELKSCPRCGGKCEAVTLWKYRLKKTCASVWCLERLEICHYQTMANTEEEAIRIHNSIPRGETCKWVKKEFCGWYQWWRECSGEPTVCRPETRCPNCGKKIEEVKG